MKNKFFLKGPVSTLLSWSPFVVMSRLTYMIYLIHVTVIDVSYSSMDQESNLTKTGLVSIPKSRAFISNHTDRYRKN